MLPIYITAATPLAHFAEGALVAAACYLYAHGARSPLRSRKG